LKTNLLAQAFVRQKINAKANAISAHPGGKPRSPDADTIAGLLISPGAEDVGSVVPPVQGEPGLLISPAYAETLRAKARIAAEQMAFTDFIVSLSYQVFRVRKGAVDHEAESQLQRSFNEAHNSCLLTLLQGFLQVNCKLIKR
jgi:hypothetical protein